MQLVLKNPCFAVALIQECFHIPTCSMSVMQCLSVAGHTNKQSASVAGMIVSIPAAVYIALLYIRKLYQSTGKKLGNMADNAALVAEDLQCWLDHIHVCDGKG